MSTFEDRRSDEQDDTGIDPDARVCLSGFGRNLIGALDRMSTVPDPGAAPVVTLRAPRAPQPDER